MKKVLLIFIFPLLLSCSLSPTFNYVPVEFGGYGEGYNDRKMPDGTWEVKIIAYHDYRDELLESLFHRRASEICDGYHYKLFDFKPLVDICSSGGCCKKAVWGKFSCL